MSTQLQQAVQNFLVMLVTGILGALGAFLIALAKKGFDWLGEKIKSVVSQRTRNDLQGAMDVLETVVTSTVTCLQQTLGDEIRESIQNHDGKYTREDLLNLKNKAIEMIMSQLSQSVVDILEGTYDNVSDLIESLVESQVYYLKLNEPTEVFGEVGDSYQGENTLDPDEEECEACTIDYDALDKGNEP